MGQGSHRLALIAALCLPAAVRASTGSRWACSSYGSLAGRRCGEYPASSTSAVRAAGVRATRRYAARTSSRKPPPSVSLASGGDVQVTAYDTTTNSCAIACWTGTTATVRCRTTAGAPVNGSFDISYPCKRTWS